MSVKKIDGWLKRYLRLFGTEDAEPGEPVLSDDDSTVSADHEVALEALGARVENEAQLGPASYTDPVCVIAGSKCTFLLQFLHLLLQFSETKKNHMK